MQVKGTVVSVELDVQVAKNGGGTYPGARFSYRDENGQLKEKGFHNNVFKFNAQLKTQLSNLKAGDVFIAESVKEGEHWNWKTIQLAGVVSATPTNDTPATGKTNAYQSPKSTYETPEERAKKQVYIVRQSAINQAISFSTGNNPYYKKAVTTQEILEIAKLFEAYVFGNGFDDGSPLSMVGDEEEVY